METRLNDLHRLDLRTLAWTIVMADTAAEVPGLPTLLDHKIPYRTLQPAPPQVATVPRGRSWQSMTLVETGGGGLLSQHLTTWPTWSPDPSSVHINPLAHLTHLVT